MKSKIRQMVADTVDSKPYNQCITCTRLGKTCGGANFLSMQIIRMGEWARIRKEYLGWTNEYIATETGISQTTIAKFLSGNIEDLKVSTAQTILGFLSCNFNGSMPCYDFNSPDMIETHTPISAQKIQHLEKEIASLEKQLLEAKEEAQRKIDYLKAENMRKDALLEKKDLLIEKLAIK